MHALPGWTTDALNAHLEWALRHCTRVHYQFPAHVAIDDVKAKSPAGSPVLAIGQVRVDARLVALAYRADGCG